MANVRFVEVAQCIESLLHDHGRLGLRQELLLGDVIEQLTSLTDPIIINIFNSFVLTALFRKKLLGPDWSALD